MKFAFEYSANATFKFGDKTPKSPSVLSMIRAIGTGEKWSCQLNKAGHLYQTPLTWMFGKSQLGMPDLRHKRYAGSLLDPSSHILDMLSLQGLPFRFANQKWTGQENHYRYYDVPWI